MRNRLFFPLTIVTVVLSSLTSSAAEIPASDGRVEAAHLLAFGRVPSRTEISGASTSGDTTVADLVQQHRERLQTDATLKRETAVKAWRDAFGRDPNEGEITRSLNHGRTYTELMEHHLETLTNSPDEYAKVLERAYRLVIRRGVYPEEITYWKEHGPISYALRVGCVENWARRNAPGLMVTAGIPTVSVNSDYLTAIRLSPSIAAEARAAIGLSAGRGPDYLSASGRTLVAAGAGDLVSSGGIHFVAAGGSNLIGAGD